MTTTNSPLHVLKAQADKIAAQIKAAERGETTEFSHGEKLAEARRLKASIKIGVVMDDKVFSIEMPWERIREVSEAELAADILSQMRGTRQ